ncbi:hypothetical protein [Thalassomonas actiniarum]|uniref:Uncharacterized protein n=1 Tax=Thalassomonas actiniarum TaxID=485447 RepID=A0AAF0C677_9GAMM|nr:hypothetical protein [Thalassomonas actiniarum]WDE02323.1 hypothetical protein SG35_031730 [Thalassomonas actiniarum]
MVKQVQDASKTPNQARMKPFTGTLTRRPFPNKPSIAEAQMLPLSSDSDFEVFTSFNSATCPVLLNVREHYQLLSDLVDEAQVCWPDVFILIRLSMPGGMRIPAKLLTDNVLLLEDITFEEQKLIDIASPLLVVEDRFSRVEIDNNDNSIHLRLYLGKELGKELGEELGKELGEEPGKEPADDPLQPLIECLAQRGVAG